MPEVEPPSRSLARRVGHRSPPFRCWQVDIPLLSRNWQQEGSRLPLLSLSFDAIGWRDALVLLGRRESPFILTPAGEKCPIASSFPLVSAPTTYLCLSTSFSTPAGEKSPTASSFPLVSLPLLVDLIFYAVRREFP